MLNMWQWFTKWIEKVVFRYKSNHYDAFIFGKLSNAVVLSKYIPCAIVLSGFFSKGDCTLSVTKNFNITINDWNNTKVSDKLLYEYSILIVSLVVMYLASVVDLI